MLDHGVQLGRRGVVLLLEIADPSPRRFEACLVAFYARSR
jgi:hypothetical protein